ncbi:MAG: hypothetical protein CSA81_09020 [Acidobacteria bacterium]|nr:MAG: hypothetical protein CSA81_09020 [Acidobacteriota bacterium]
MAVGLLLFINTKKPDLPFNMSGFGFKKLNEIDLFKKRKPRNPDENPAIAKSTATSDNSLWCNCIFQDLKE